MIIARAPPSHQYRWLAGGYDLEIGQFYKWLAWWLPGGQLGFFLHSVTFHDNTQIVYLVCQSANDNALVCTKQMGDNIHELPVLKRPLNYLQLGFNQLGFINNPLIQVTLQSMMVPLANHTTFSLKVTYKQL